MVKERSDNIFARFKSNRIATADVKNPALYNVSRSTVRSSDEYCPRDIQTNTNSITIQDVAPMNNVIVSYTMPLL